MANLTKKQIQDLASKGRGGDTILAHINPEEARLLKEHGGSGTINPNTGLPEFKKFWKQASASNVSGAVSNPVKATKNVVVDPVVKPVSKALAKVEDVVKEEILAKPAGQILLMVAMPYAAAAIAPYLAAALPASLSAAQVMAISTAVAQTTVAIASGVPPDKALEAAIINSSVNVGAGELRPYVNDVVKNQYITNAVTNAAATATRVAASGGSQDQIEAALSGSLLNSSTQMLNVIPGYSNLPVPAKNVLAASLVASAKDKPVDSAAAAALFSSGVQAVANGVVANNTIKEKLGRDATADEITKLAFNTPAGQINKAVNGYINSRIVDPQEVRDAFALEGRTNLTPQEIERFVKTDVDETSILSEARQEADKTATTTDELKDLFNRVMGRDPNKDEIAEFTGEKPEETTLKSASGYIDERQVTKEELANLFKEKMGVEPSSYELEQFTGEKPQGQTFAEAEKYIQDYIDSTGSNANLPADSNAIDQTAFDTGESLDVVYAIASREEPEEDDPLAYIDEEYWDILGSEGQYADDPLTYLEDKSYRDILGPQAKDNSDSLLNSILANLGQISTAFLPTGEGSTGGGSIGSFVPAIGAGVAMKYLLDDNGNPIPAGTDPGQNLNWNAADPTFDNGYTGQALLNPTYIPKLAAQGGLMSLARGGISTLGGYSDGGRLLKGPGDGMSDNIPATIGRKQPARLADGEFVVPADVVSHLGNGSTEAGANVLYKMMDKVRRARTGNSKQGRQINPNKFIPS